MRETRASDNAWLIAVEGFPVTVRNIDMICAVLAASRDFDVCTWIGRIITAQYVFCVMGNSGDAVGSIGLWKRCVLAGCLAQANYEQAEEGSGNKGYRQPPNTPWQPRKHGRYRRVPTGCPATTQLIRSLPNS